LSGAFASLREFITALEAAGELVRIKEPLSPHLEIAALSDLVMKAPGGGRALLFENPAGYDMPVLVNAFGSKRRIAMALGGDPDDHARRIDALLHTAPPTGVGDLIRLLPTLKELKAVFPKRRDSGRAPCQEVVLQGDSADLTKLPVLFCWPDDGGPFVTLPCVFTKDPVTGRQNCGMYRLQIFDEKTTGMHWHIHKDGSASFEEHRRKGERMEVAVAIGTDPAVTYAATAPLPRGVDEMMFAGFLRKKPVEMVKAKTVDLWVPATAEIILEGYVVPGEERVEGPFGDHTGYYSPADPYPVFHVTAITHRKNPVYFATVVGIPPMEDEWLGWATERLFLPLLRTQWPEVTEMHLPVEGVFHNLCLAAMKKHYPMQARRLMSGFWGAGQMSFTKIVAVLGEEDPVGDVEATARLLLDRVNLPGDLVFSEGVLDALDHSSPHPLWGGKLGIDATPKVAGEPGYGEGFPPRRAPAPTAAVVEAALRHAFPELKRAVVPFDDTRLCLALLVLEKKETGRGAALARAALEVPGVDVAVAVEGDGTEPLPILAWRALSSIDPKRDVHATDGKLAVDATRKNSDEGHFRTWPDECAHPPEVLAKVRPVAARFGWATERNG